MRSKQTEPCMSICVVLTLSLCFFPAQTFSAGDTAMFIQGNDLLIEQNYAEALGAYDMFVKENSEHYLIPAALWTMANIHFAINEDYEKAAALYGRIINENADTEWELFSCERLGTCYEELEKLQEAAETYQDAVVKFSGSGEEDLRIRLDQMRGSMISCYQNMNDHESLIRIYKEMLTEDPTAASAPENQYHLAQTYLDMEAVNHAAKNLIVVVERYPTSPYAQRVQSEHGELLASQYNYDWTPFTTYWSAVQASRAGHYDESRAQFDEVIETKQNTDIIYAVRFQKELIEFRLNGDATAFMEKLDSTRDDYPYGYGGVRIDGVNATLQRIVDAQGDAASSPEDVGAYLRMGWAYYQMGAYQSAIEAAEQGITRVSDSPDLYNMLGYCYINLQKYEDAIGTFERLIAVAPDDPNSYDSMAECYYTNGDTTMAIQLYQKSLAVDSMFTNPYYMLGRIYQETGQTEKAQEHLEQYLELAPDGFQAQNAQNLLNQINPPSRDDEE